MDTKKTFDVAKPGKSSPESTSRPIIVSNRSIVKDPTLTQGDKASADPELEGADEISQVSNQAKAVTPPDTDDKDSDENVEKTEEAGDATPDKNEADPAENDSELDPTISEKKKANKLSAEEKAHQETIDKLVSEGKYVVPIGQVKRRRNMFVFLVAVILILIVTIVSVDLLIDAGMIKTNIKLPINLINN